MYTYEIALEESTKYFDGDDLAAKVFVDKYALKNKEGDILEKTPADMHRRLAKEFARIEAKKFKQPLSEETLFDLFDHYKYIVPQGSPMSAIGNPYRIESASNCFVLNPPLDAYNSIHHTDHQLTAISKRRGGVGVDISNLRPAGTPTNNAARSSTGIIPFLERYSNSIREVGQNARRGALMVTLSIHHPEAVDFAESKKDLTKITGANISLRLSDEFMQAVKDDDEYEQMWPIELPRDYAKKPTISKLVKAREVWNKIIKCARDTSEPGLLFWDTILRESPADCYADDGFKTVSTNPSLRGNTLIYTKDNNTNETSWQTIKELDGSTPYLKNINGQWVTGLVFQSGSNEKLYKIIVEGNKEIYCTAQHYWPINQCKIRTDVIYKLFHNKFNNYQFKLFYPDGDNLHNQIDILSIEETDIYEDVYDIIMHDDTHTFMTECGITGNCGEITLSANDACRLLLLNLYSYVVNPFTDKAYFDYSTFANHAQIAQRLMDNLVDLEIEQVDKILAKIQSDPEPGYIKKPETELWKKIRESCINGRRTGTGVTGLADTLAALGFKYGEEDATNTAQLIYKVLKHACYLSSVSMAIELGPFKVWDHNKEKDNPFLNRLKSEPVIDNIKGYNFREEMQKYGRRNISLLTTAPAGTVSTQTQTSSGIEPVFMLEYTRRKKINPNDSHTRVDFVDQNGDKWQEFKVYHHKLKDWMKITGETDITKSPWWGACAEDLDWQARIKMQGEIQKHIDHSISCTVNLPEDISEEEVSKIYMTAWESGCKGVTIYRKNSRTGVLIEKKTDKQDNWNKRPNILDCDIHHSVIKGNEFFVLVSQVNGKPYEVFTGNNIDLKSTNDDYIHRHISKKYTSGRIKKIKRGHYQLLDDENSVICENISIYCTEGEEAISRLVSTLLRHRIEIRFILDQLEKSKGEIHSFGKALGRVLKKYVKDGEKVSGADCPQCGNELRRMEGCISCTCGYSKC